MNARRTLRLFEATGVELEYMIVDAEHLDVLPITDELLKTVAGSYEGEVDLGEISWSNELALHVVELKTTDPAPALEPLPKLFFEHVQRINNQLAPLGGRLMPTAMHPWMNPDHELRLWPHEYNAVYEKLNQIFDCRGHGWANLQSAHINLPFSGDEEFGRLHAAIRLVLPILPAIAASSPIMEGRLTEWCDTRLEVYRTNAHRIPSVTGRVVPEPVFTQQQYEEQIFKRIYDDVAPFDPEGVLRFEWMNARGAIARFERNSIELRLLDTQECPQADLAVVAAVVTVIKALAHEMWSSTALQQQVPITPLEQILLRTTEDAEAALIDDSTYLELLGYRQASSATAGQLWRHLLTSTGLVGSGANPLWSEPLETILTAGPLARRIRRALGRTPSSAQLRAVYGTLCDLLAQGRMFTPS